jgi:hypothetical protein
MNPVSTDERAEFGSAAKAAEFKSSSPIVIDLVKNISRTFSFPIEENFKLLTRDFRVPVILDTAVPDLFPDLSKRRAIRADLSAYLPFSVVVTCSNALFAIN